VDERLSWIVYVESRSHGGDLINLIKKDISISQFKSLLTDASYKTFENLLKSLASLGIIQGDVGSLFEPHPEKLSEVLLGCDEFRLHILPLYQAEVVYA
jgi:hypothetical protein